jgi:hypothetical protein
VCTWGACIYVCERECVRGVRACMYENVSAYVGMRACMYENVSAYVGCVHICMPGPRSPAAACHLCLCVSVCAQVTCVYRYVRAFVRAWSSSSSSCIISVCVGSVYMYNCTSKHKCVGMSACAHVYICVLFEYRVRGYTCMSSMYTGPGSHPA